jgi:hypothetical protein
LPDASAALVSLSKSQVGVVVLALENEKVSLLSAPTPISCEELTNKSKKISDGLGDKATPCFVLYQVTVDGNDCTLFSSSLPLSFFFSFFKICFCSLACESYLPTKVQLYIQVYIHFKMKMIWIELIN